MYEKEGYELIGAAMEVYNCRGFGFHEDVWQECMEIELGLRGIPFLSQPEFPISYKERKLTKHYEPDLVVFGGVIAELKIVPEITKREEFQVLNYMRASDGKYRVGYVISFGSPHELLWKRLVL